MLLVIRLIVFCYNFVRILILKKRRQSDRRNVEKKKIQFCPTDCKKKELLRPTIAFAKAPFKIEHKEQVGRCAFATTDYQPGELILAEQPFAFGPKTDCPPLCLGCYSSVDCSLLCSSCAWPVCSTECESVSTHKEAECSVFSKHNVKFNGVSDPCLPCPQYECITPLRVLLAKERDPKRWEEEVQPMQSHDDDRKKLPLWQFNQVNVVEYLRGPCNLKECSEELIHRVCGILDVNAFEANTLSGNPIRCLYPKLAVLSHNCVSNTAHSIASNGLGDSEDFRMTLRAAIPITKGTELFSSYTYSLWPTLVRREYLKESKYFDCTCSRCSDPTELETHMSTLKCTKCDNGVILSSSPLEQDATWKCTHCEFNIKGQTARKIFSSIQADLDVVEGMEQDAGSLESREQLYRRYRSVLHPRNAYNIMLGVALAQMYGKTEGYTPDVIPDVLLERKYELCKLILQNIDVVEPGYTRLRGMILYELHAPIILLSRNLYNNDCIDKKELKEKLLEAIKLLKESSDILTLEPENTHEGMIGRVARQSMQQLTENLDDLLDNA